MNKNNKELTTTVSVTRFRRWIETSSDFEVLQLLFEYRNKDFEVRE